MHSWFTRWQVPSTTSHFHFSEEVFLLWQREAIGTQSNPKCFVFTFYPNWNIRIQQLFKIHFQVIGRMDGAKKQQAHFFSHFSNLTSPVKIIKAAAFWSFIFPFKLFFPWLFLQSLKKDDLQFNNTSIFAQQNSNHGVHPCFPYLSNADLFKTLKRNHQCSNWILYSRCKQQIALKICILSGKISKMRLKGNLADMYLTHIFTHQQARGSPTSKNNWMRSSYFNVSYEMQPIE